MNHVPQPTSPTPTGFALLMRHPAAALLLLLSAGGWPVANANGPGPAAATGPQTSSSTFLSTTTPPEDSEPDPLEPHRPADLTDGPLGRDASPLVVESLGLAMLTPAGATVSGHRAGAERIITIGDGGSPPEWTMSIQRLSVTSGPPTPDGQLEAHFGALREAGQPFKILLNEPRQVAGRAAQLCYLDMENEDGGSVINGWLIVPLGERMLLIFSSLSTPDAFATHRTLFEAMFRTVNLRSAEELSQRRLDRLEAGRTFLSSITPEKLRSLVGREHWTRVYRPGKPSAGEPEREVGYAVMQIRAGRRGELNPERPEHSYSREERMEGIFIRVQGRLIGDLERAVYFDSIGLYWMAWDQSAEAWSVRGTQRQGAAERGEAETGLRLAPSTGNPRPTLTVIHTTSSKREPYEWSVPDAYLSQALAPVMALLLPTEPHEPRDMAYYQYHNAHGSPQLSLRFDRWEPEDTRASRWRLTTRIGVDAEPVTNLYDADGRLIRRSLPDGVVAESTTLPELRRLWERKGLPLGPSGT